MPASFVELRKYPSRAGPKSDLDKIVGARIRERRRSMKMTAQRLGELIGVSREQIANYERGEQRIAAARLYEVSVALQLPINEFFNDVVPRERSESQAVDQLSNTLVDMPDPPGQRSDAEVIARLGRLASEIADPVVRASVRSIMRRLPVFALTTDTETSATKGAEREKEEGDTGRVVGFARKSSGDRKLKGKLNAEDNS